MSKEYEQMKSIYGLEIEDPRAIEKMKET